MNELTYEEMKAFCNSLSFGDVVINHWAGEGNTQKNGVFVKKCSYAGSPCIEITNMKGKFWYFAISKGSKLEKRRESIFINPLL